MIRTILIALFIAGFCSVASAQSCAPGLPRTRVTTTPVINLCPSGSDSNDGMTLATPLQTLPRALDCADGNFDVDPAAGSWAPSGANGFVGRHVDVIIKLCATSPSSTPFALTAPAFYKGQNTVQITGPSTNRWDAQIYTANGYQGITAQGAGHLVISNLEMLGDGASGVPTPTFINALHGGLIMLENVGFSDAYQRAGHVGKVYPIGADMQSRVVQTGPWYLDGCHYGVVMAAIGGASAVSLGGYPINWGPISGSPCTSATYDLVYSVADASQITNETLSVNHVGMPAGGNCAGVTRNAIIEFDPTAAPSDTGVTGSLNCSPGGVANYSPGSWVYWNNRGGLKVMGTDGAWH